MFVEYATTVGAALPQVEKSLDRLRSSLGEWADVAYREGEHLRARVGPGHSVALEVRLDIGNGEVHNRGLVYPVHWTAAGATMLFPELNADLVLSKAGAIETTLTLRGTYEPPLGPLGRLADRALLRHIAEATVADWMERLAEALRSETIAAGPES